MNKVVPKSNREWILWGNQDPLYGVCGVLGKSKTNRDPWEEADFYGRAIPEFATNLRHWEMYGMVRESCVEIGCGAGRMTSCLQSVFSTVHACDVSPGMLALVKKNCDPNVVKVWQTDGVRLPLPDESVTGAYSTIVFQHFNSPKLGLAYFAELYRVLKSGGTFMINLPWHQFPNATIQWPYRVADGIARGYDSVIQGLRRTVVALGPKVTDTRFVRHFGLFVGNMSWDFRPLVEGLGKMGFRDVEVHSYYVLIEERHHPFFFGRKP